MKHENWKPRLVIRLNIEKRQISKHLFDNLKSGTKKIILLRLKLINDNQIVNIEYR